MALPIKCSCRRPRRYCGNCPRGVGPAPSGVAGFSEASMRWPQARRLGIVERAIRCKVWSLTKTKTRRDIPHPRCTGGHRGFCIWVNSTGWLYPGRTTSTGIGAPRTTLSATLPNTSRGTPPRPCVARAIRSAPAAHACRMIAVAGCTPTPTSPVAERPSAPKSAVAA